MQQQVSDRDWLKYPLPTKILWPPANEQNINVADPGPAQCRGVSLYTIPRAHPEITSPSLCSREGKQPPWGHTALWGQALPRSKSCWALTPRAMDVVGGKGQSLKLVRPPQQP